MQWQTVCLCVTSKLHAFKHVRIFKRINHCSNSTEEIVVGNKLPQVIFQPADTMWYILYASYSFSNSYFPKMLCVLIPFKDKPTVMLHSLPRSKGRDCVNAMSNEKGSQSAILLVTSSDSVKAGQSLSSDLHEQCQHRISGQPTVVPSWWGKKRGEKLQKGSWFHEEWRELSQDRVDLKTHVISIFRWTDGMIINQ